MSKKFVFLLAAAVMLALIVVWRAGFIHAAKTDETGAGKPTTITMWKWSGAKKNIKQVEALAAIFPELFDRIKVEYIIAGGNGEEVCNRLRLALAAGKDIPDMVSMNYSAVAEFASAGVLKDLSEYIAPYEDDLTQAGLALTQYNGKTVTVPKTAKSKLWFYRSDMFAEAGIVPEEIKTAEEFMAAAQQFHDTFPDSYIINLGPQPIHYWYFTALSHWDDSRVATENGEYLLTTHESFAAHLQFTKDLYDSGLTFRTDDFSPDWNQAFIDSRIGSWLGASWGWHYPSQRWAESPNPEQWGVALWPEFMRKGADSGGGVLVIPKDAPNGDLAGEYLAKQFLTTAGSVSYFEGTRIGVVPITISGLAEIAALAKNPVKPEGMSDQDWATDPLNFWKTTLPEMMRESYDVFQVYPYDPVASAELDIMRQHAEALLAGRHADVQEALEAAQADMASQLGNPYDN
jgi:multiple sugar transport system substrate-binding protein